MIVKCTGCQARFRVADEKVGPRGARVRCSKCQTVFVVKREAPAPPPAAGIDLDLTPGLRRPSTGGVRPAPPPAGAAVIPFPITSPSRPPPPDPFAAAGLDAFGGPAPAADDPFARVAGPASGPGAGLAAVAAEPTPAPSPDDPFAASPAPAFGGLSTGTTGAQSLAVTDLSQLLGTPPPANLPAAEPPPRAASALASPLPPDPSDPFAQPAPEPQLGLDPQPGMELPGMEQSSGAGPRLEAEPQRAMRSPAPDLALEETSGSHQAPFADPSDVMMSSEQGVAFDGAAFEVGLPRALSGTDEPPLALATEPTPAPPGAEVEPAPPRFSGPPPGPAIQPTEPLIAAPAPEVAQGEDRRQAGLAGLSAAQRLRSAAVNALALVALLAIALGFRVVLRGDASPGPSALRPSTLLRALRGGAPEGGAFEVAGVRTGVYAQTGGGAVLFVRGEVVSRAPGPVGAVRVEAELVRGGEVLARGEIRAGAVPTPEEIDRARDRDALDRLTAELRKRAPRKVAPGDRLAFLVPLGEAPVDVSGTSVRVRAEAEDAGK